MDVHADSAIQAFQAARHNIYDIMHRFIVYAGWLPALK
jgi:hypothetical protein